jgi:hypothetical protein
MAAQIILTGNTYPHRDAIKAMGGTWDPERKAWTIARETMAQWSRVQPAAYALRSQGVRVEVR